MTREIKFRAWHIDQKEMSVPFTLFDVMRQNHLPQWFPSTYEKNNVLMQFTGLKDKKGKEIYEGDIVTGTLEFPQLFAGDTDENSNFLMGGIVFYHHHAFQLRAIEPLCHQDRDFGMKYFNFIGHDGEIFRDMEIIGNVHENPDLLK